MVGQLRRRDHGLRSRLTGVVDLSPTNAWAVGEGSTSGLIEHWNGTAWSAVTLPDPDFSPSTEDAISADSASDIWVVGSTFSAVDGHHRPRNVALQRQDVDGRAGRPASRTTSASLGRRHRALADQRLGGRRARRRHARPAAAP